MGAQAPTPAKSPRRSGALIRFSNIIVFLAAGVAVFLCWWRVTDPLSSFSWSMAASVWGVLATLAVAGIKSVGYIKVWVLGSSVDAEKETETLSTRGLEYLVALPARRDLLWVNGLVAVVFALTFLVLPKPVSAEGSIEANPQDLRQYECEAGQDREGWTSPVGDFQAGDACAGLGLYKVERFRVWLGRTKAYWGRAVVLHIPTPGVKVRLVAVKEWVAGETEPSLRVSIGGDGGDSDKQEVIVDCAGRGQWLDVLIMEQHLKEKTEWGSVPPILMARVESQVSGTQCDK